MPWPVTAGQGFEKPPLEDCTRLRSFDVPVHRKGLGIGGLAVRLSGEDPTEDGSTTGGI